MSQIPKTEFFAFFRQRLVNIQQIENLSPSTRVRGPASFNPELNILLSAELDALAKYWAINQGQNFQNSPLRMGEFLAAHAGLPWRKCSYFNLLKRTADEAQAARYGRRPKPADLPDPIRQEQELDRILHNLLGQAVWTPQVLSWQHDVDLDTLATNPDIAGAGITRDWLSRSRYGEMLYRHHRSGWIHALNPDPELETEFHMIIGPDHEPCYFLRNGTRAFAIPTEFILASFQTALNAFEAAASDPILLG